ncbi:cytidine deaminase-like protein [Xylona heveae TC161]|uniref:Cytidine deaminase-like protein n=1 Tax=Xylona heveae (strain CBS 132557 / TC161) TaxID=1328760 RepID=A0A161TFP5_XYLHT|nr:cytidine deaminase-like protein [Xylona heveae TC161]KZF24877.1 cytidine deaminase-like protein [Xylona heveae TC161]
MASDSIAPGDHRAYMALAVSLAEQSPPRPTNFRVGAVIVDAAANKILATGYTLELPGNTHAEQCCLDKIAQEHNISEDRVGEVLPNETVLYTTMEPCGKRMSGHLDCVARIMRTKDHGHPGISKIYLGVKEPRIFVGLNAGRTRLWGHGIECVHVPGFEDQILKIATAGHDQFTGKHQQPPRAPTL